MPCSQANSPGLRRARATTHGQGASLRITSIEPKVAGFGGVMQSFAAEDYRGKRVRFSAWIKTRDVERGAHMFLRVDQFAGRSVRFDNLSNRAPKGTTDWTLCQIVLEVPVEGAGIAMGVFVSGTGEAWYADAQFEVVGQDVPTTDK